MSQRVREDAHLPPNSPDPPEPPAFSRDKGTGLPPLPDVKLASPPASHYTTHRSRKRLDKIYYANLAPRFDLEDGRKAIECPEFAKIIKEPLKELIFREKGSNQLVDKTRTVGDFLARLFMLVR